MANWELAQLNIAKLIAPIDSPVLAEFVANLDRINALAEQSPGFVWRYEQECPCAARGCDRRHRLRSVCKCMFEGSRLNERNIA